MELLGTACNQALSLFWGSQESASTVEEEHEVARRPPSSENPANDGETTPPSDDKSSDKVHYSKRGIKWFARLLNQRERARMAVKKYQLQLLNLALCRRSTYNDFDFTKYITADCFSGFGEDGNGFYKVYQRVFDDVFCKYRMVAERSQFGDSQSPESTVKEFYQFFET